MAQSANAQDDNLAPENPTAGGLGPSRDDASEETDSEVEIVEEGEEGETAGPVSSVVRGQLDLTLVTYRIGHSRVAKVDLDKYVEQGLLIASLCGLWYTLGPEEVPRLEPYEAVIFHSFFEAGLRFPCEDFVGKVLQRFNL